MAEFKFPEDVLINNIGAHVMLGMPVAEAWELLAWLDTVPTHTFSDPQFMYLTAFKRKLQEAIDADA